MIEQEAIQEENRKASTKCRNNKTLEKSSHLKLHSPTKKKSKLDVTPKKEFKHINKYQEKSKSRSKSPINKSPKSNKMTKSPKDHKVQKSPERRNEKRQ